MTQDALFTLAEIAIALAGFSAVVVIFRRDPAYRWRRSDANRFHGMVFHALAATLFCFVPVILQDLGVAAALAWRLGCGALAVITALQILVAVRLEAGVGSPWVLGQMIVSGVLVVGLLAVVAAGAVPVLADGAFVIGVFWHVLQAAAVFLMLIWIAEGDQEPR